jgi:hypothetical protein
MRDLMTRRTLIGTLLSGFHLLRCHSYGYGYVDIDRAMSCGWLPAHVYLDGVDVSQDCRTLDDRAGWVELLERNEHGRPFLRDGQLATVRRAGRVVYVPKGL